MRILPIKLIYCPWGDEGVWIILALPKSVQHYTKRWSYWVVILILLKIKYFDKSCIIIMWHVLSEPMALQTGRILMRCTPYFLGGQTKLQSKRFTNLIFYICLDVWFGCFILIFWNTLRINLLFENPMTFNCFWAIKNFQLTLMTK